MSRVTYRAVICDRNEVFAQGLGRLVNRAAEAAEVDVEVMKCPSLEQLPADIAREADLFLIDCQPDEQRAVDAAHHLQRINKHGVFVLLADKPQQPLPVGENAYRFLLKGHDKGKILDTLTAAFWQLEYPGGITTRDVIEEDPEFSLFRVISHIEASQNNTIIHTARHSIATNLPMSYFELNLDCGFAQCHRHYIVNTKFIAEVTGRNVLLESGQLLPVAEEFIQSLERAFRQTQGDSLE